jgi:hypothetical protein
MRILTRSSHADFAKAHPQLPRPESCPAKVKQRRNLGDGGYTLTSDRRETVTVAMRNGFAWAQRWELETSAPFTGRRRDFRNGSRPCDQEPWGAICRTVMDHLQLAIIGLFAGDLQRDPSIGCSASAALAQSWIPYESIGCGPAAVDLTPCQKRS